MSKVLALYHIVFGTAGRCPVLKGIKPVGTASQITAIAAENQSKVMIVNSVDDHLHLLLDLSPEYRSVLLWQHCSKIKCVAEAQLRTDVVFELV